MDVNKANAIVSDYTKWLRDSIDIYQEGENSVAIVYPMLDRHNDHMSIYLTEDEKTGGYCMTDLGYTIDDLAISGCDVMGSKKRLEKLDSLLPGYGIKREGKELYVITDRESVYKKMNMLIQSMATVDDLFFTVRDSVRNFFLDDIGSWMSDVGIRAMPNIKIAGTTGFDVKFDFGIAETPHKAPERYIKAVNSPSKASVENALFGWQDVKAARKAGSELYVFMNKSNTEEKKISQSLISACRNYDVEPVIWDNGADEVREALIA